MPSEKLLRLDPCLSRGPFVDHIPSFPRLFGGIRIFQGILCVVVLAITIAGLVVRDGDGVWREVVYGTVFVGWISVAFFLRIGVLSTQD